MENFLQFIDIRNFKSVKQCSIKGCRRINVFLGRGVFGTRHIFEALSVFSLPFLRDNRSKSINQLIYLENETEIFYNGNSQEPVKISTNNAVAQIKYQKQEGLHFNIDFGNYGGMYYLDERLNVRVTKSDNQAPFIRKYSFATHQPLKKAHSRYLIPPYGHNLFGIIERDARLKDDIAALFAEYRLNLVFDKGSQSLKIMQSEDKSEIFLVPYNSIADTLQRIIFFKTAVASNDDCVLLFEEPEAHSFPPYMTHITQEMIHKKSNQYFAATHSPFILNDFLENSRDELAVFMVHYENHETKLRKLDDAELHDIYQHGVDLFTNSESYI